MATLLDTENNTLILLRSQHIFGRHSGSSNTVLENPEASRLHASILWSGSYWLLQDASSNGTFLNNEAIGSGSKKKLKKDDIIRFGAITAPAWVLQSDDPPKSMLVPLVAGRQPIELEGIVVLPDVDTPEIMLYQASNGEWVCEDSSGLKALSTGVKVTAGECSWYFVAADTFDNTLQAEPFYENASAPFKFNFTVSMDEEHVSLVILFKNKPIDLGERTHHYLLLFLARKRIKDHQQGLEDSEQGWIDKDLLSQQTGLDEKYINIQIYRFREQLIKARPSAMQLLQVIERRRGWLRFAFKSIEINGGNDLVKLK